MATEFDLALRVNSLPVEACRAFIISVLVDGVKRDAAGNLDTTQLKDVVDGQCHTYGLPFGADTPSGD